MTLRIGLTGGIGSGKSTVAGFFEACGLAVIDADAISRALTAPGGAALPAVRAAFGPGLFTAEGWLDRAALRQRVFADDAERARLEAILHPMIGQAVEAQSRAAEAAGRHRLFDVPLLVESGRWRARVDRVVVIDCPVATQRDRVQARSGWTAEAVDAVIARQATRDARRRAADAVIANGPGRTLAELEASVQALCRAWGLVREG